MIFTVAPASVAAVEGADVGGKVGMGEAEEGADAEGAVEVAGSVVAPSGPLVALIWSWRVKTGFLMRTAGLRPGFPSSAVATRRSSREAFRSCAGNLAMSPSPAAPPCPRSSSYCPTRVERWEPRRM